MTVTLLEGHVVDVLAGLPAGHFHCAVTSPPYAWLRAYSTEPQVWQTADGDALCAPEQHEWVDGEPRPPHPLPSANSTLVKGQRAQAAGQSGAGTAHAFCLHCHAWRGELGQEPTIELYVAHLVAVFRAVKRVLRADGTLWVNLAGCYYNDPGGQNGSQGTVSAKAIEANGTLGRQKRGRHPWLKPLDWVDVPGLFARAMQQDGWCWRSDVIWLKPSALPESVSGTRWERCRTKVANGDRYLPSDAGRAHPHLAQGETLNDPAAGAEWADCPGCPRCSVNEGLVLRRGSGRPTKATERILLFTRGPGYYYDADAVREAHSDSNGSRFAAQIAHGTTQSGLTVPGGTEDSPYRQQAKHRGLPGVGTTFAGFDPAGRNLRDWWVIGPEPLKDAHYAAFPSALPERCIKAGSSEWGCCPACGAPWARCIERGYEVSRTSRGTGIGDAARDPATRTDVPTDSLIRADTTLGWRPTCAPRCPGYDQPPVPCRVLDMFGGSGTTALAANRLGRDCTLVELKSEYAELARKRVGREPLSLFAWRHEDTPEEVEV